MKHDPLAWYPWYWKEWRLNRKVKRMNMTERGIYRELLDECWIEGSLPSDLDGLAEIAGCPLAQMRAAWPALQSSFTERPDGRIVNDKIARVHAAQFEAYERQVKAGKKGARKRWAPHSDPIGTLQGRDSNREERETTSLPKAGGAAGPQGPPPRLTDGLADVRGAIDAHYAKPAKAGRVQPSEASA